MMWSSGDGAHKTVTKIDLRAQSITFDYGVRTSDNVKLRLKGIIFWRVTNVPIMIKATSDPRGDVWHHSRSILIQAVSKAKLAEFMNGFNEERGTEVQSMEVTSFECVDEETAKVLQEIIRETTDRINKLQAQESQNEVMAAKLAADVKLEKQQGDVRAAKIAADIMVEKQRLEFLKAKQGNDNLESTIRGDAEGLKLTRKAATFIEGLKGPLPDGAQRLELYKLHETLQAKNMDTKNLAGGSAQ